ncbi:hypothetical protein Hte_007028 [Hypoxylon texense]
MSRHMACKQEVCRDRKVRCDGEPNCENCRRMGEMCVYIPSGKPTRADLAQTVEILQDRLDRAEAYIAGKCNEIQRNSISSSHADSAHDSAVGLENPDQFLSMSGLLPSGNGFMTPNSNGQNRDTAHTLDGFDSDMLNEMSHLGRGSQDEGSHLQLENLMANATAHNGPSTYQPGDGAGAGVGAGRTCIPSLQEIRALSNGSHSRPGTAKSPTCVPNETEEYTKVLLEGIADLSVAIFAAHAEMAGVASVVAEYLAWVRKTALKPPDSARILEILETRVRELHQMAENRHRSAWQHTTNMLENMDRAAAQLKAVEEEIQSRTARVSQFFDGKYNVSVPLSEQRIWDDGP